MKIKLRNKLVGGILKMHIFKFFLIKIKDLEKIF